MKKILLAVFLLAPFLAYAQEAVDFEKYFVDRTMRIDVFHTGDAKEEMFTIDRVIQEGPWAGNPRRTIVPFELGRYLLRVHDAASGTLVYSKGFDSYFGEYKTTEPGVNGIKKTFPESLLIPFPKSKVRVEVLLRDRENRPQPIFNREIDPADMFIVREKPADDVQVVERCKERAAGDQGRPGGRGRRLYSGRAGKIQAGPGALQRRSFSARSPTCPTRTVSISPACSRLPQKAAATSPATVRSRTRPWERNSIPSARSATC